VRALALAGGEPSDERRAEFLDLVEAAERLQAGRPEETPATGG
jgi:hypothetical protein